MRSLKQLTKLFLTVASLLSLSACQSFQITDIEPTVTLPASQDCYSVSVLSHKKKRIPKDECEKMKKRAIFLSQKDWQKQRYDVQKNCQLAQCKQLVGAFDELFKVIDLGLQSVGE